MSLQGSFETIALPDLMALLAASSKSGELRVVGGHVEGRLWLQAGRLVGSKVAKAHGHVDAIFELLRLSEGNFVFRDDIEAPEPEEATPVEPVVRQAQDRLEEWQDIVQVVPSVEHRVRLIADLPTPEVTLSADEWRLVMAIALAGTVQGVLEELQRGEFEGFRGIRRLVDAGLVLIDAPRVRSASQRTGRRSATMADAGAPPATPHPEERVLTPAPASSLAEALGAHLAAPLGGRSVAAAPTITLVKALPTEEPEEAADEEVGPVHRFPMVRTEVADDEVEPGDAPLETWNGSPRRHLATARVEEPMAPVSTPRPGGGEQSWRVPLPGEDNARHDDRDFARETPGEPINRGLLLKFLSSVRS